MVFGGILDFDNFELDIDIFLMFLEFFVVVDVLEAFFICEYIVSDFIVVVRFVFYVFG